MGITQAEFARRDGCSAPYVNQAITTCKLKAYPDGSLDPALVGSPWRETNRRKIEQSRAPYDPEIDGDDPPPDALPGEITLAMTRVEAERTRIIYDVLKKKREHDLEVGKVVLVEEAVKQIGAKEAQIRTKMLAIPNGHAPQIHALKTVMEVQDYLLTIITEALEALSDG